MIKMFSYLLMPLFLVSCVKSQTPVTDDFSPAIPGGVINGSSSINPVTKLVAVKSGVNEISLTWANPRGYDFLNYEIKVYRLACDVNKDSGCALNENYELTPMAYKITTPLFKGMSAKDSGLNPSVFYSFFVCIFLDSKQGPCQKISIQPDAQAVNTSYTITSKFWELVSMITGESLTNQIGVQVPLNIYTIDSGVTELASAQNSTITTANSDKVVKVTGRLSSAKGGTLLFYPDTKNNRVIIYSRLTMQCDPITMSNGIYSNCIAASSMMPLQPINILGQPDQRSSKSCKEHERDKTPYLGGFFVNTTVDDSGKAVSTYDKCMSSPTSVFADEANDKLLVTDSGNNRILVYGKIPAEQGCDPNISGYISNKVACSATGVIGKKSLTDLSDYSFFSTNSGPSYGDKTLNNPIDIKVYDDDLYILDSGNHRLIKIYKYSSPYEYNCTSDSWDTPNCRFSSVLGQKNLLSRDKFNDLNLNNFDVRLGSYGELTSNINFLRNHFSYPSSFKFTSDGKLLIAANEDFEKIDSEYTLALKGRILVFEATAITKSKPDCTESNFDDDTLGLCFAKVLLGQSDYKKIPRYRSGGDYLQSVPYGLGFISSVEQSNSGLIAVSPQNNSLYIYSSYTDQLRYDVRIDNPNGSLDQQGRPLPTLKQISSIIIDGASRRAVVSDVGASRLFDINLANQ